MGKIKFFALITGMLFALLPCKSQVFDTIPLPPAEKTGGMPLMEAIKNRQSQRSFSSMDLSMQQMSNLLWAAYGVNRPNGYRTVPSAKSYYEFDIYLVKADGWYRYVPEGHFLIKTGDEDLRKFTGSQDYVQTAPVNLIYVADFERMTKDDEQNRIFWSACNVGFISQNVYLYCASEGLATVVRGQRDTEELRNALKLRPAQHVVLAQTIGHPEE
jgi:SagB-type dehydrogenase family enzyme